MLKLNDIVLNNIWQAEMGWDKYDSGSRKFNDEVELAFWDKLAPSYTQNNNLYNECPLLGEKIKELIGSDKNIIEIGCGTGNFTVPLAKYSKTVFALDFSLAMLYELQKKLNYENLSNVQIVQGKWEDVELPFSADYVVSVNSLYRIYDIQQALTKIINFCQQGFVIVRTIQRPFFHKLYTDSGLTFKECLDYKILPLILWNNKINANVNFVKHKKTKQYSSMTEVHQEIIDDLGESVFRQKFKDLEEQLLNHVQQKDDKLLFTAERITVIIDYHK